MTHQDECPAIDDLTALLIEHGPAAMASALSTLINHAMQIEREQVLQAESHESPADRQGYANGFKPKILKTRVGHVDLRIPQSRGELPPLNVTTFRERISGGANQVTYPHEWDQLLSPG